MKKFIVAFCIAVISLVTVCYAAPPSDDFQLMFSDEFDGDSLNTELWNTRKGISRGGVHKDENNRIENGKLYIDYKKEADGTYTCGGIITKLPLTYGYYETRVKVFGETGGLHTSFWTADSGGHADGVAVPPVGGVLEIDGFEIDSETPDRISMGHIDWILDRFGSIHDLLFYDKIDASEDFITMGFLWEPNGIKYYINDELVKEDDRVRFFGATHLWLTALAMPDSRKELIDDSKLPGASEFEYFRYYQRPMSGANLIGNFSFEYDNALMSGKEKMAVPDMGTLTNWHESGDVDSSFVRADEIAYDDYCYLRHGMGVPYAVYTSQKIYSIVNGTYKLSAYVMGNNECDEAYLAAYDKNGNLLCKKDLGVLTEDSWTKVELIDIPVTENFADVGIYSKGGEKAYILADSVYFELQTDAEKDFEIKRPWPIRFSSFVIDENPAGSVVYNNFEEGFTSSGVWKKSSLAGSIWLEGSDKDGSFEPGTFARWTFKVPKEGDYVVEYYKIAFNGSDVGNLEVSVGGETKQMKMDYTLGVSDWNILGTYHITPDMENFIEYTPGGVGTARATKVRVTPVETYGTDSAQQILEKSVVLALNNRWAISKNDRVAIDSNLNVVPFVKDGRTLVPIRFIAESLGATVGYDDATANITITLDGNQVALQVGSNKMYVNGEEKILDVTADTYYDRTFVPLRAVSEAFGKAVDWFDNEEEDIIIIREADSEPIAEGVAKLFVDDMDPFLPRPKEATYDGFACYKDEILMGTFGTPGFTYTGDWDISAGVKNEQYGIYSIYNTADSDDGETKLTWMPEIPESGKYAVEFYNHVKKGNGNLDVTVKTKDVEETTKIYGSTGINGWLLLGVYDFEKGTESSVSAVKEDKYADYRASAVRFIPIESYENKIEGEVGEIICDPAKKQKKENPTPQVESYKNEILLKAIGDSTMKSTGSWSPSGSIANSIYVTTKADEGDTYLEWTPKIKKEGEYVVEIYNIVLSGNGKPDFTITHADGSETVTIDQSPTGPEGWVKIGTYKFNKTGGTLRLTAKNVGVHDTRASFIRLIPIENYDN